MLCNPVRNSPQAHLAAWQGLFTGWEEGSLQDLRGCTTYLCVCTTKGTKRSGELYSSPFSPCLTDTRPVVGAGGCVESIVFIIITCSSAPLSGSGCLFIFVYLLAHATKQNQLPEDISPALSEWHRGQGSSSPSAGWCLSTLQSCGSGPAVWGLFWSLAAL